MTQRSKLGDVFQVSTDASTLRYFQYVSNDATQLNSQVVCVFRETYDSGGRIDIERIASGGVDFYAHVFLTVGIKQKQWRKVGHAEAPKGLDVHFRDSNDYGDPRVVVSNNWHVWKANGPFQKVGKLPPQYRQAEIGVVVPPDSLIHRMREGRYDFVYPDFEH